MDKKKVVMVVDDEPGFCKMVQIRLEANDYNVITAFDGEEALAKLNEKPDVILLDVMMPKVDGYTFVREIKTDKEAKDIPIIVISAKSEMKEPFLMEGVNGFLVKPIDDKELIAMLKKLLG
jgi:adenylate cyclase